MTGYRRSCCARSGSGGGTTDGAQGGRQVLDRGGCGTACPDQPPPRCNPELRAYPPASPASFFGRFRCSSAALSPREKNRPARAGKSQRPRVRFGAAGGVFAAGVVKRRICPVTRVDPVSAGRRRTPVPPSHRLLLFLGTERVTRLIPYGYILRRYGSRMGANGIIRRYDAGPCGDRFRAPAFRASRGGFGG